MKVMKFGGSSLKDAEAMLRVGEIVTSDPEPKVVVVSAVQSVTDMLIDFVSEMRSEQNIQEFIRMLKEKHISLLRDIANSMETKQETISLLMEKLVKLERVLYGICYLEELTPRTMDLVQSFGERFSVILVSAMLQDMGVNAVPLMADEIGIISDGHYGSAGANLSATRKKAGGKIRTILENNEVPVITGFYGVTEDGHVTVFGRNGTDYSASVIAYAIEADALEIWKEVDGFMSVDPKVVPDAVPIAELSYEEAAELSYFGARVLHPRTVEPAREAGIEIRLMNVFKPDGKGTVIHSTAEYVPNTIKSISCMEDMVIIKAYGAGIGARYGVMAELSGVLRDLRVNIYSAATSQTCVSLLINRKDIERVRGFLSTLARGVLDRFEIIEDMALVCVVGESIGYSQGVAARVCNSVAEKGVNISMISAGASMVAYCFIVRKMDIEAATLAIHLEFFGDDNE
ncbi:MAG TPA: aspartate kinase [Methanomassiliicoccales archaeon]|nr:aspartate kinase [Methanomassiliicoccales archaeon]